MIERLMLDGAWMMPEHCGPAVADLVMKLAASAHMKGYGLKHTNGHVGVDTQRVLCTASRRFTHTTRQHNKITESPTRFTEHGASTEHDASTQ